VHSHAVDVGAVQQRLVRRRIVAFDPVDQLVLTQKASRLLGGLALGDVDEGFGDRERRVRDRLEGLRFCARGRQ
jgi:hypothetical protein